MSNAIKMKKDTKKKQNTTKISQSIPAHFYKNYIPPKTPKINPIQPPAIPQFEQLPQISPSGKGINISKTGGFSLTRNKHPMSMPATSGLMGPKSTPFTVDRDPRHPVIKEEDIEDEQKADANSLEQRNKKLTVGSFTCFDIMDSSSPLKQLPEAVDQNKDTASATSQQTASTFASNFGDEDEDEVEVAPEDDDDDEEGGGFDIEL